MWTDTHCHLDASGFDHDRDEQVQLASQMGVEAIVVPAVNRANWDLVSWLPGRYPQVCYTLGIHPLYVAQSRHDDLRLLQDKVKQCLADTHFIGIGEIGLDLYEQPCDLEQQIVFFKAQLRLAREFDLPVLLHVRRAQDQVLKYLRLFKPQAGWRGIAHAFNGSTQQAEHFLQLGLRLGIGGASTFEGSKRIRGHFCTLPLSSWVIETDAPDIAPAWLQGARNSPTQLPRIAQGLAQLRNISEMELSLQLAENTGLALGERFWKWKSVPDNVPL